MQESDYGTIVIFERKDKVIVISLKYGEKITIENIVDVDVYQKEKEWLGIETMTGILLIYFMRNTFIVISMTM